MTDSTLNAMIERHGSGYRWLAMLTVLMGTIATILTSTIVNVALPQIMTHFELGQGVAHWVSTGFLAAMTVSMLTTSWLIQRLGLKAAISFAMLLFAGSSVLGGLSSDPSMLIFSRILQGAAAGMLQPMAMFVLFRVFPRHQRGRAMGIYGIGVILAPALGPVLGGIIVDQLSWRYVFFVPLPMSLLGFLMALIYMPGRESHTSRFAFDWVGLLLICLGIGAGLDALTRAQHGAGDWAWILAEGGVALACMLIFARQQALSESPLLKLSLLRVASFRNASIVAIGLGLALYGSTYLIPLFVQSGLHLSATQAGMIMLPAGVVLGLLFPLSGMAADRLSPGKLVAVGMGVFGIATLLWLETGLLTPVITLMLLVALGRVGLALMMPALSIGALLDIDDLHLGQASGMLNFFRQFGAAFGTNVIAVILELGNPDSGTGQGGLSLGYFEAFFAMGTICLLMMFPAFRIRKNEEGSAVTSAA